MRIFVCLAVLVAFASAATVRSRRQTLAKESPFEAGKHDTEPSGSRTSETAATAGNAEQVDLFPKEDMNIDTPRQDKPKKRPSERRRGPMGPMGMGMPPMMGHPGMMGPHGPMHPMMGPPDMSHMPQGSRPPFGMPTDPTMMPPMGQHMPMQGMPQGQMPEGHMFGGPMGMPRGQMGPGFPPGFGPGNFTNGPPNGMPPMGMGMPPHMAMMRGRGMPPMMSRRQGGPRPGGMPPMMRRGMPPSMHSDDSMMQHGMPPMMQHDMPPSMHGDESMMQQGMPPMMHPGMPPSMHGDESMMHPGMPPSMHGDEPMMHPGMSPSMHGDESMMHPGMPPMMQRGMPPMMQRGMPPMMQRGMPPMMPPHDDSRRPKESLMASVLLRGPPRRMRKPQSEDGGSDHKSRPDRPTPLDLLDPQDDSDIGRFLQFDGQIEMIRKAVLNSFYKDLVTYRAISKVYQTKMLAKLTLIKELEAKISMPVRGHVAITSTTPHMPAPSAPHPMEMEGVRVESNGHYPSAPLF